MRAARGLPLLLIGVWSCAQGIDTSDELGGQNTLPGGGNDAATDHGPVGDSGAGTDVGSSAETGGGDGTSGQDGGGGNDTGSSGDGGSMTDTSANDTGSTGCTAHGFAGTIAAFDLSGQSGSEVSAPATTSATDVTVGALGRASPLTAVSGSGSINSSGWASGSSADPTLYYTFEVTPSSGCTLSLTTLALDVKASATGPTSGDVATSADNFGTHTQAFTGTSTPTVSLGVGGVTPIEIRIYGYGASGTGGTLRVQNTVTLSGSIN